MRKLRSSPPASLALARVLVVHDELAPRLTLQTILKAGGYAVDTAATPSEAIGKLDAGKYELVLSSGSEPATRNVLAYARVKEYHPATAIVSSSELSTGRSARHVLSIYMEDLPQLLGQVAHLIGVRASRRYRPVGQAVRLPATS